MIIKEIFSKNIISKSNLPGSDYVINPYIGCNHSCIYCYARFMKRFSGHNENWGEFVDVKINSIDLIPEKTSKYVGRTIFLSSVTDPYIPIENKYNLTRGILNKLINLEPYLSILTKSALVTRDIDLIKEYAGREVGMTITTLDDSIRKRIEPFTSSVDKKLNALRLLKESGIKNYVFIGPILPSLSDWKSIIMKTKDYVDSYMFENLNLRGTIATDMYTFIHHNYPHLIDEYRIAYRPNSTYWNNIEREIVDFCEEQKVSYKIFFHHKKETISKNPLKKDKVQIQKDSLLFPEI